jgi:outer membrane protein
MYTRYLYSGLLLLIIPLFSHAQEHSERIMTLQECLKLAVENSPRLRINALEQTKLGYRYQEALGTGLPHINISASFDDYVSLPTQLIPGDFFGKPGELIPVQFGTSYNLAGGMDLSQIIYNQTWLVSLRMAKLAMQQNQLESERTRIEVIFNVAQSYYYAQISKKQILNRKDNLQKIEKAEQIALSQYKNGMIKKVDVDRIVVNKLNVQTEIDRLQVMYAQQLNMQRYFMGLDLNESISFSDSILPSDINLQAEISLSNHIDIRMLEKQKQLAQTTVSLNRSGYFPSVNLIGAITYTNQSNAYYVFGKETDWFNTSLLGVRLNVPVFSGFQKHYKVSQSKVEIDQLAITEDNTRRILSVQSKDATSRLLNAINDEKRQRENMRLAERVYAVSQEQYQKGIITLTDLLDTESGLAEAQTNHSLALVQMKISELDYRKANGILLEILEKK